MTLDDRIGLLADLGEYISHFDERLGAHMHRASHANGWFTVPSQKKALGAIADKYLQRPLLEDWVSRYRQPSRSATIGVVAAGNIPAVAFYDLLAVFVSGHKAQVKLSERDPYLIPFLIKVMGEWEPAVHDHFDFVDRLQHFDAVIATGSNNSARYFEQYFGKYPNIIRKNRNAVALLTGDEDTGELRALAGDVFEHFGLGCRNVSHVMVPESFDMEALREPFADHQAIMDHSKYRNNYDYNLAIAILNKEDYHELGTVILKQSEHIISPIGCLAYSRYSSIDEAMMKLSERSEDIQCVVSKHEVSGLRTVPFGEAQSPALDDYADGIDTMQFLTSL